MVSKAAVIAIVVILACPILLGYALSLDEVTHTSYETENNKIDVTPLLWNSVAYSYTKVDAYQLNSNLYWGYGVETIPIFNKITTTNNTSYPLREQIFNNYRWNTPGTQLLNYPYYYEQFDYDPANNSHTVELYETIDNNEQVFATINNVHSYYFEQLSGDYSYTYYNNGGVSAVHGNNPNLTKAIISTVTGRTDVYVAYYDPDYSADIAAGFYFKGRYSNYALYPENSKSGLFTINLDSITDSNYSVVMIKTGDNLRLTKTTTGSDVSWRVQGINDPSNVIDLYYNPSISNNSYQIYLEINKVGQHSVTVGGTTTVFNDYKYKTEFRYVGEWPTSIGQANSFMEYSYEEDKSVSVNIDQPVISMGFTDLSGTTGRSPTMRIDGGAFGSMQFRAIENQTYDPADFRTNPSTTLSDISVYGTSLTFGGNTYDVTNGNITLGTHTVSVSSLVFDSVPISGGYENRINGNVVSTTVQPSTITLGGTWVCHIITDSMTTTSYIKTDWIPGQFAWDGLDQNFLMVGLLTAIGAFIALGIAYRKVKAAVWSLLIACGGAVLLFFTML